MVQVDVQVIVLVIANFAAGVGRADEHVVVETVVKVAEDVGAVEAVSYEKVFRSLHIVVKTFLLLDYIAVNVNGN